MICGSFKIMSLLTLLSLSCFTDLWHPSPVWHPETRRHWADHHDLLWSLWHQQWGEGRLWGHWWTYIWGHFKGGGFPCRVQIWLPGYWLWKNSKPSTLLTFSKNHDFILWIKFSVGENFILQHFWLCGKWCGNIVSYSIVIVWIKKWLKQYCFH